MISRILVFMLFISNLEIVAQSASHFIKEAELLVEQKDYVQAEQLFSKAIALKPSSRDGLEGRSFCYMKLAEYTKAIDDFKFLINIKPHNVTYIISLADAYLESGKAKSSVEYYKRALSEENDNLVCYEKLIYALIKCKEYESAQLYCNDAMSKSHESPNFFFLRAVSLDSLGNYQTAALSYERAIKMIEADIKIQKQADKSHLKKYYYNLANDYLTLYRYEDAEKYFLKVLIMDKSDIDSYIKLGKIYYQRAMYNEAIAKYNEGLAYSSNNTEIYYNRGLAFIKLKQSFTAIQDFNFVLKLEPTFEKAYIEKAMCYEDINQFDNALLEFNKVYAINPDNTEISKLIKKCKIKQFENNRESEKPIIQLTSPMLSETQELIIPVGNRVLEIKGKIIDLSRIQKIVINDESIDFETEKINPTFIATISVENKTNLTIKVVDIYNNFQTADYTLTRKESNIPIIELIDPLATSNNEIYLGKNNNGKIQIEGRVNDESYIKTLLINNVATSISVNELNPTFTLEFDCTKSDTITIEATDFFGNYSNTKYILNRKAATEAKVNPMGITWVIFISNSNYLNFTSLDGPEKDKVKLKEALANYRIDKFIEKKNMTKEEMEKFFAIELRNLLKSTQVNSLLIWYAGHGKYLNDNGYWIPVNANKGEEYSYFQITNLKGYISTYKLLKHILVVSDACETGPAFCLDEINLDPGMCDNSDAINLTSSQVFTSSTSEQSSDKSIFAETFSNLLKENSMKCISIENIKEKVSAAVIKNQKQRPKFGHITGLENKGGSFYFMKR